MDEIHAAYGGQDWHRLSAGPGSKGERWYDWQCWLLAEPEHADWGHYLLFRRSVTDAEDWQPYVADRRWTIEHAFEAAKQETRLNDYEVRSAHDWYRHVTLALWALALLAVVRAADLARPHPQKESAGRAA